MAFLATLPLLILLAAMLALPGLNRFRPGFRSNWLLTAAVTTISLLVLFYLRIRLPLGVHLNNWSIPVSPNPITASWTFDSFSLPFAVAVLAIALAAVIAEISRAVTEAWYYWLPGLALTLTALLAVMAANPLALSFSWALLDGLLLILGFLWLGEISQRRFVLQRFLVAVLSVLLLLGSVLLGGDSAQAAFSAGPNLGGMLFLLALALRLGVLPLNPYLAARLNLHPSRWVLFYLVPMAAALGPLARIDLSGLPGALVLFALVWLAAFYAALRALGQDDRLAALPFWMLAAAGLTVAGAIQGAPLAAQAAGLAALLFGALLALADSEAQPRWPLVLFGIVGLGALPFTPSFGVMQLYRPGDWVYFAFLLPQALLLFSWLRLARQEQYDGASLEPWARKLFLVGLAVLPLVHLFLALGLAPDLSPRNLTQLPIWPAGLLWASVAAVFLLSRRQPILPAPLAGALESVFSFRWFYQAMQRALAAVEAAFRFLSRLLEGQAGVLWALLMITLLLSLVAQLALEAG